jgi:hypothetical protein
MEERRYLQAEDAWPLQSTVTGHHSPLGISGFVVVVQVDVPFQLVRVCTAKEHKRQHRRRKNNAWRTVALDWALVPAVIKKRKHWPRHVPGTIMDASAQGLDIGATDAIQGVLDNTPYKLFVMKDAEFNMKLMSTYGSLVVCNDAKEQIRMVGNERRTFRYTEPFHNHYTYWTFDEGLQIPSSTMNIFMQNHRGRAR